MKVAFVSQPGFAVLPPAGSVEIVTRELARRLADRHDVTIYGSAAPGREDVTDGLIRYRFIDHRRDAALVRVLRAIYRMRPADKGFFTSPMCHYHYWLRVAKDIRRSGCDVVHVANLTQALPVIRRFNPDLRIVLHMHCEWLIQLDRRLMDRRLRHADVILGVSDHITDPIRDRFPQHAARCRTVYNGVEIPDRVGRRAAADTVTLLHVGRISPEKGHHVLVEAMNQVVRGHPQVRLVLVGEEAVVPAEWAVAISDDPAVRALAQFYGRSYLEQVEAMMTPELAERTTFTGRLGYEECARAYAGADMFVFPSYFESLGVPPIEAMAAALPVISTPVGGVRESVRDGEVGVFVERGDAAGLARAITELVEDPARRAALGAAGRVRAAELFSWDRVVADFESALRGTDGDELRPATSALAAATAP